jgi:hypothetical protein
MNTGITFLFHAYHLSYTHFQLHNPRMSYRPPTTSKYSGALATTPVEPAGAFTQRRRDDQSRDTQDWSAFGGGSKHRQQASAPAPTDDGKTKAVFDTDRNSLSAYLHLATKDLPKKESGGKWEQSAIRRKPAASTEPDTSSQDMFPSLGSPTPTKKIEKSSSSLSLAERMKIRLQEEEEERQRQEARAAAAAREREEEERRNRMTGILAGAYVSRSAKRFEAMDCDIDYSDDGELRGIEEDLDCDAYGRPYAGYDYAEEADEAYVGSGTPEFDD